MTIGRDQVDHVVDLARLKLSDEERESPVSYTHLTLPTSDLV